MGLINICCPTALHYFQIICLEKEGGTELNLNCQGLVPPGPERRWGQAGFISLTHNSWIAGYRHWQTKGTQSITRKQKGNTAFLATKLAQRSFKFPLLWAPCAALDSCFSLSVHSNFIFKRKLTVWIVLSLKQTNVQWHDMKNNFDLSLWIRKLVNT